MNLSVFCEDTYDRYLDLISEDDGDFTEAGIILNISKLIMWIVGILGNFVNSVVFGHKNMADRPINLIFWWLSVSDLLELAILALHQWSDDWFGHIDIFFIQSFDSCDNCAFILIYVYLYQVLHTITIGLTILLVFYQYMAVARPLTSQKHLTNKSIRLVVIWIYISSFFLHLPFWYAQRIEYNELDKIWWIGIRNSTGESKYQSEDPLVNICILVCGVLLRIGLLIILIILSILFLYAIRNILRNRENLGMQAHHLSEAQRNVNRMNITVAVVIIMFSITEVPSAISGFSMLFTGLDYCSYLVNLIVFPFTLLNCCYSIFCYLFRIKQYRETLKLLLSFSNNWVSSRASVVQTIQTESELHTL